MNKLRVWWSSYLPITKRSLEQYEVENIAKAREKIKELTERDLRDKSVTDNVGGLEAQEKGEWTGEEWYCEECGEDISSCECEVKNE